MHPMPYRQRSRPQRVTYKAAALLGRCGKWKPCIDGCGSGSSDTNGQPLQVLSLSRHYLEPPPPLVGRD